VPSTGLQNGFRRVTLFTIGVLMNSANSIVTVFTFFSYRTNSCKNTNICYITWMVWVIVVDSILKN